MTCTIIIILLQSQSSSNSLHQDLHWTCAWSLHREHIMFALCICILILVCNLDGACFWLIWPHHPLRMLNRNLLVDRRRSYDLANCKFKVKAKFDCCAWTRVQYSPQRLIWSWANIFKVNICYSIVWLQLRPRIDLGLYGAPGTVKHDWHNITHCIHIHIYSPD